MKNLLTLLILLLLSLVAFSQNECDKLKVVAVYDFPPSPATPGGNYILLLLTVTEDAPNFPVGYTDLFFIDEVGDTITIPLGWSNSLPRLTTDTIPYTMKLVGEMNNLDFPENFNGHLHSINPGHPDCETPYSNIINSNNEINEEEVWVYPNPFQDKLSISGAPVRQVSVFNELGRLELKMETNGDLNTVDLSHLNGGIFFVQLYLNDGRTIVKKVVHR